MDEQQDLAIFAVLADIDMEDGSYPPQAHIDYLGQDYHWGDKPLSKQEIARAVEHCLASGWIKILSEQDCETDRLRWVDDPHQNWSEGPYSVGSVEFTSLGWDVYTKQRTERLGARSEHPYTQNSQYLWRTPGQVSMISMSKDVLLRDVAEVRSGSDSLVAYGLCAKHTLGEITGPYAIGPWWVKRFALAPDGYRVDISFEPPDLNW